MDNNNDFLPHFCRLHTLFGVVVMAQLLVFLLVLAQPAGNRWWALSVFTLYVQWVALGSCIVLCLLQRWLNRLTVMPAAVAAGSVIVLVTIVVTEVAWRVMGNAGALTVGHLAFHGRAIAMAGIVAALLMRYFYLQRAWRGQLLAETQARVHALQSRIRPHFLFNSLNTIASMIRRQPKEAEQAVEDLAELFRAGLRGSAGDSTLRRELDLCRDYLRIEALRLGDRLQVQWHVDALPQDARLPPLTLQPLVENAVYHGVEPLLDGGEIRIDGDRQGDRLRLSITNPVVQEPQAQRSTGMGMAQDNVRQRLQLAFGKAAWLHAEQAGPQYVVTLVFPYKTADP